MAIASANPTTGDTIQTFDALDADAMESRLAAAEQSFRQNRSRSVQERAQMLEAAARILEAEADSFARTITLEIGKLLPAALDEVLKCVRACRFYAANGAAFLADQPVATDLGRSFIRYEPFGPVLAIMPWNFPFWQVFRFAAPALMAGNVGLLKHASKIGRAHV